MRDAIPPRELSMSFGGSDRQSTVLALARLEGDQDQSSRLRVQLHCSLQRLQLTRLATNGQLKQEEQRRTAKEVGMPDKANAPALFADIMKES